MSAASPNLPTVLVAMSGGVDSSVAALLLKNQGHEVAGATLKLFHNEEINIRSDTCCSLADVEDARAVAYALDIPHYVFNFTNLFKELVIERFAKAWQAGFTPNPCIDCNTFVKFPVLLLRATEMGYTHIATGHYAKVRYDEKSGRYLLLKSCDPLKDQSYVLYTLTQAELSHLLLPLGEHTKLETRALAATHGLVNARKRDSQDICFVPDKDYAAFLCHYSGEPPRPGFLTDKNGTVLGTHAGHIHYTIGQRRGLGLALGYPAYVCAKDVESGRIVLGQECDLYSSDATVEALNLIAVPEIKQPLRVTVKFRCGRKTAAATVLQTGPRSAFIHCDEPQRALTPGQSAVFYDGDIVIGGGIIR
jgi:tRNA-specific 2-thiouridylase